MTIKDGLLSSTTIDKLFQAGNCEYDKSREVRFSYKPLPVRIS